MVDRWHYWSMVFSFPFQIESISCNSMYLEEIQQMLCWWLSPEHSKTRQLLSQDHCAALNRRPSLTPGWWSVDKHSGSITCHSFLFIQTALSALKLYPVLQTVQLLLVPLVFFIQSLFQLLLFLHKVNLSGEENKEKQRVYSHHSGWLVNQCCVLRLRD